MALQSSLVHFGLAKEVTPGTPVAASIWLPVDNNFKAEDDIKWIDDKGLRGAPAAQFASYQGPMSSSSSFDTLFYPDSAGHLLMALMGKDAVIGSANPYSHAFTLAQGQPPAYTLSVYNGFNERQFPGSMLEELDFKWAVDGALSASTKWSGYPSQVATTTTPAISALAPFLGWQTAVQIGGSPNAKVIGFDWTAKRSSVVQWAANNSQKPAFIFLGPLDVTSKLTLAIADDTEYQYMLNNNQIPVVLTLTAPNNGPVLTIQMSQCNFRTRAASYSKEFVTADFDLQTVANSTDAGSDSPVSPVQLILQNAQSQPY